MTSWAEPAQLPATRGWADPGRRIGWQYALGILGFAAAQGLGLLAGAGLTLATTGGASADPTAHPWPGLALALTVQALLAVAGFRWLLPRLSGRPSTELAGPGGLREFGAGLALGCLLMLAVAAALAALGVFRLHGASWNTGILVGLAVGIGAGFAEEILFRGMLLRLLDAWLGTGWALAVTAALFGAAHLANPGATAWGALAIAVEAGLLLGAAYLLTRRLWLAIGLHVGWNFVEGGVLGADVSGAGVAGPRGWLSSELTGPAWLSGAGMGIEGSVITVVAGLALGVVLLRLAARRGMLTPSRGRRR